MVPPQKKQKTHKPIPAPRIFKAPGWKPDVCLKVFRKEFHVVSLVLKLHSEFFRKFFEPSGGILPSSSNPAFISEWFTALDELKDGVYEDWALSSDRKFEGADYSLYKGDIKHQETAFENLLCAIFGTAYRINTVNELGTFVGLARYYAALPAASRSIFDACKRSDSFIWEMKDDPLPVMEYARVLRNESLFQDSLILSLGPWSDPKYRYLSDPILRDLAISAHFAMSRAILYVHQKLLFLDAQDRRSRRRHVSGVLSDAALRACSTDSFGEDQVYLPSYYRECSEDPDLDPEMMFLVESEMVTLFYNDLKMKPDATSGKDQFLDHFLFLDFEKTDFPWDTEADLWYS